jgi:ketosteroid isomerase-like protein
MSNRQENIDIVKQLYNAFSIHFIVIKDKKICKFQEFFDTYIAGEAYR